MWFISLCPNKTYLLRGQSLRVYQKFVFQWRKHRQIDKARLFRKVFHGQNTPAFYSIFYSLTFSFGAVSGNSSQEAIFIIITQIEPLV